MNELKTSVNIIAGILTAAKNICVTAYQFVIDPIATMKGIADPIFLAVVAALILSKALGFKGSDKYIKLAFIIYIIILIF